LNQIAAVYSPAGRSGTSNVSTRRTELLRRAKLADLDKARIGLALKLVGGFERREVNP